MITEKTILTRNGDYNIIKKEKKFLILAKESAKWIFTNSSGKYLFDAVDGEKTIEQIFFVANLPMLNSQLNTDIVLSFFQELIVKGILKEKNNRHDEKVPEWKILPRIESIYVEIEGTCNLNCLHCFSAPNLRPKSQLSTSELISVLKFARQMNPECHITFSGGEPFLRDDIRDLVQKTSELQLPLTIITNGSKLELSDAILLEKFGISKIQISLDGPKAEVNDKIRGAGSFAGTMNGISNLHSVGLSSKIWLSFVPNKLNIASIHEYVELALKLNIGGINVSFLNKSGNAVKNWELLSLTDNENRALFKEFSLYKHMYKDTLDFNLNEECVSVQSGIQRYVCPLGAVLRVDLVGNVYPCLLFYGYLSTPFIIGNVKAMSIKECVESEKHFQIRKGVYDRHKVILTCSSCEINALCGSGCSAQAFHKYGTICHPYECENRQYMVWEQFKSLGVK